MYAQEQAWTHERADVHCIGWLNVLHAKCDVLKHYWRVMPDKGQIRLEHHRLLSGIRLWSNSYDPDISTISPCIDSIHGDYFQKGATCSATSS